MPLESPQKGFYDTFRQFQQKDNPRREVALDAPPSAPGIPVGQVVAGLLFLALITLAFVKFAVPERPPGLGPASLSPPTPPVPTVSMSPP